MSEELRIPLDALDAALRAGPACAAPERLAAAAAGELAAAERAALLAHAASCAACGAELALAREFFEGRIAGAEVEAALERLPASPFAGRRMGRVLPMHPRRRTAAFRPAAWAAAASVLIAVALGWVALQDRGPTLPDRPITDVVRGGRLEISTPLGVLQAAPPALAWSAVAGAAGYRVEILGVDGEPVAAAEVEGPEWVLPGEVRSALETFVAYRVRVVALDAAGSELASSPAAELRLEPVP